MYYRLKVSEIESRPIRDCMYQRLNVMLSDGTGLVSGLVPGAQLLCTGLVD